jgi:RNA polymerase sigma-70 factor (ECF subfamily)
MAWWRRDDADERLIRAHGDAVWRAIVRVLGSASHDAADCFQQAFVELCDLRRRQPIEHDGAMFKRIAIARAIDAVRRRVRERTRSSLVEADSTAALDANDAEAGELLADLRDALAELPEQQATAFVLTQIEGEPHAVAAAALGVTANHVGVLVHRARATLRGRLESHRPVREARS